MDAISAIAETGQATFRLLAESVASENRGYGIRYQTVDTRLDAEALVAEHRARGYMACWIALRADTYQVRSW